MSLASPPATPGASVRSLRALALTLILALVALGLAWELWLAPTGRGTLALKVLPLLLCLPGVLRHRLYTFRALSLLLWLYCGEGLLRATSERGPSQGLAAAQVLLSLALFAACAAYIRLRLRGPKADTT